MSKYHPIDVRYTGPSTAYVGNKQPQAKMTEVATPTDSPWGTTQTAEPTPAPQSSPPKQFWLFRFIGSIFRSALWITAFILVVSWLNG